MRRKVYEVDPLTCPQCRRTMRFISFLDDLLGEGCILNHLKLNFVAETPALPLRNSRSPPYNIDYESLFIFFLT